MKRLFNRLYYVVETLFLRGAPSQLLVVAMVVVAISLVGGTIVFQFSPQFGDLSQAIWWAFLRLTDPGYLGDDHGALVRVVSTCLTLSGYVIFLGALVAIMTNGLSRFMAYMASGRSQILEKDHILIVGWHARLHAIIEELIRAEERVTTRLGRARLPAIVILAKEFRPDLLNDLRDKLPADIRDQARLLVRSGNPLEAESLARVDFIRASSIILLSQASADVPRHFSDMTLVKVLMSLRAQIGDEPGDEPSKALPNVVLDIAMPANKILAESVGWQQTEAIAEAEFMSRLLCQSIRHPGLSQVFVHLLTDMYGESLYLARVDELGVAGRTIRQMSAAMECAIPLGYLKGSDAEHRKEARLRLLDVDEPLAADDELICVAPSIDGIIDGCRGGQVERGAQPDDPPGGLVETSAVSDKPPRRILLVGWSHFVRPLIVELGSYQQDHFEVTIVSERDPDQVHNDLRSLYDRLDNVELTTIQSGLNSLDEVARIKAERFDNITLLSPEFIKDPLLSDAETVMAFVLLDRYLQSAAGSHEVAFLAELNDEDNQPLLRLSRPADILITQEIVSHLLSQVALRRALAWIYEELFTFGGSEIRLRPFEDIVDLEATPRVDFRDCQRACLSIGSMAIGYKLARQSGALDAGVHLNPGRATSIEPGPADRLIVVEG